MKRHQNQGFTLVEMMVVVGIAAILAAVALPAYRDYNMRGKWAANIAELNGIKKAIVNCLDENGGQSSVCAQLGNLQRHGYAGNRTPRPKYATDFVGIADGGNQVVLWFWGTADLGFQHYVSCTRLNADTGSWETKKCGNDNISDKYIRTDDR